MSLTTCLKKARSQADPAEDYELLEDLKAIEAEVAEKVKGGMDEQAARDSATQARLDQAVADHAILIGRVKDAIGETNVPTGEQQQPSPGGGLGGENDGGVPGTTEPAGAIPGGGGSGPGPSGSGSGPADDGQGGAFGPTDDSEGAGGGNRDGRPSDQPVEPVGAGNAPGEGEKGGGAREPGDDPANVDGEPAGGQPGVKESPREKKKREARERAEKEEKSRKDAEETLSPREKRKRDANRRAKEAEQARQKQTPKTEPTENVEPTGSAVDDLWDELGAPVIGGMMAPEAFDAPKFDQALYERLRDKLTAVVLEMSPERMPLDQVTDALFDYLYPTDEIYEAKADKLQPFLDKYIDELLDGKIDPWAAQEAPVEEAPAEEPIPEPEPEPEPAKPLNRGMTDWDGVLQGLIARINTQEEAIPPAFKSQWIPKREAFNAAIQRIYEGVEALDFQDRLRVKKGKDPISFVYVKAEGGYETITAPTYLDMLKIVGEVADENIFNAVDGFQQVIDNSRYRVPYRLLDDVNTFRYKKAPDGRDYAVERTIPSWEVLSKFVRNRLRIHAEKKKTPIKNINQIEREFARMTRRVRADGPAFVNPKAKGFLDAMRSALNNDYDTFLEALKTISKDMQETMLPQFEVEKRKTEIREARAAKHYARLVDEVQVAINEVPEGHEKRAGFVSRYSRITSAENTDPVSIKTVDLETLLFQIERMDDKYVSPDPLVSYTTASQIEAKGGSNIGSMIPSGQAPGWNAYQESFMGALEQAGLTIDDYVVQKMGYDSLEEIIEGSYLSGEQIDALATIIRSIDTDGAFILANQTGTGKGRQLAAAMAYSAKQGFPVVFMSEKVNLFGNMIDDLTDIGMRKKDAKGKPIPGRFITYGIINSGSSGNGIIDKDTIVDGKPLQGVSKTTKGATEIMEKAAENWEDFGHDIMMLTYTQINAQDMTNNPKAKDSKKGGLTMAAAADASAKFPRRKSEALRKIAINAVVVMDESHEAASEDEDGAILGRADRNSIPLKLVYPSRGGVLRDVAIRARSIVFSSATFAKRPDNMDIYAIRTNMWRALVGIRDQWGFQVTMGNLFKRGGVAMQQIFSGMMARDGGMIRLQRGMSDAVFKTLDLAVPTTDVDNLADAFSRLAEFSLEVMAPHYEKMKTELEKQVEKGVKVDIDFGDFPGLMHNFTDIAYASLTVDQNTDKAIEEIKAGRKTIITFANTGESMLKDFMEANDYDFGDEVNFTMADIAKAYLRKTLRYRVSLKLRGRPIGPDPVYERVDPAKLAGDGQARYLAVEMALVALLEGYIGSPFDHAKNKMEAAGIEVGEITGRGIYLTPVPGTTLFKINRRSQKGPEHNRKIVRRFNGGLLSDPIPENERLSAVIMNRSGAVGTSMHASEKFADQSQRVMIVAQGEKDINLYIQILGRIDRTGQVLEREVDGEMVANNPTYYIPKTTIPIEARMRAVLEKKLEMLSANLTAAGKEPTNEEEVTQEQIISPIGSWAVAQVLRENDKWRERILIPAELLGPDDQDAMDYDPDLAGKATKNVALLPYKDQVTFYEEVTDYYRAEAQRRRMHGENIGAMDVQDIRAVGRKSLLIDKPVGSTQFEGGITAIHVTAEYTNAPVDFHGVMSEANSKLEDEGHTSDIDNDLQPITALAARGVKKVGDFIRDADDRVATRKKEIDEDSSLSGDQKESRKRDLDRARNYLINGDKDAVSGLNGPAHQLSIGKTVKIRLDGDWRTAVVTNMTVKESVNPYSPAAWKVDLLVADPHKPFFRSYAVSNFGEYDPLGGFRDKVIDYKTMSASIGNIERDVAKDFEEVRRKVEEGVEQRVIITGNIIRAFAKYGEQRGSLTQITDPTGNMGAAYLLNPQYSSLDDIQNFMLALENGNELYDFMKLGGEAGNPTVNFHPDAPVHTFLTDKDDDGNPLEHGKDIVFSIPNRGLKNLSLGSKFGDKNFLAFVNKVEKKDIEGTNALGTNPISSVKYHFKRYGKGQDAVFKMRVPLRMDTRDVVTRGLQWWRNNTNPENIIPRLNGSPTAAEEVIKNVKQLAGGVEKPWPKGVSVLEEQDVAQRSLPLLYNKDIPFRYDPDKMTPTNVKTEAEEWVEYLENRTGGNMLAASMAKDFVDYGSTNLMGLKAETMEDIAILGQSMRHPMFEKMNAFIVKNGEIVDYFSVSNRLPGSTSINGAESLGDAIKASMAANKADGYYLTHNHPGGDPTPSGGIHPIFGVMGDRGATIGVAQTIPGFKGHIVLDEDKYGVVPPQGMNPVDMMRAAAGIPTEYGYVRPLPEVVVKNPGRWSYRNPLRADASVKEILDVQPSNGAHFSGELEGLIAGAGKKLIDNDNTFLLIGTSAASSVSGVMTVPVDILAQANTPRGELKLAAWLRKFHFFTSSNEVYAYGIPGQYRELVVKAMQTGLLAGVMDPNATIISLETPEERTGNFGREKQHTWLIRKGDKWERLVDTSESEAIVESPRAAADVRAEIKDLLGENNSAMKSGRLRVVQSDSDLPGHLQLKDGAVQGVVDNSTGKIYIVADNVGENARGVVLHEVGVHAGLKRLLGDKYNDIIRQIRGLRAIKNPAAVEAYSRVPEDVAPENIDEEALGYLVENPAARDMSIFRKVLAAVRAWAFRHGFPIKSLSVDDIIALATAAAKAAARDKAFNTPLDTDGNADPVFSESEQPPSYSVLETVKEKVEAARKKGVPKPPNWDRNQRIREKDRPLWDKIKKEMKRQFSPGGLLPESVFNLKIWRDTRFEVTELDIKNIIAHYDDAVMKDYGVTPEKLDPVVTARINDALAGGSMADIEPNVQKQIGIMASMIDRYSVEYGEILWNEIAQLKEDKKDEAAAARAALLETINNNRGKYVHRSYQVFDDPKWPTKVPDKVLNDAFRYLTAQAEEQAQKYDDWAQKAEDRGEYDKADRHRKYAARLRDPDRVEGIINYILKNGTAFDQMHGFIKEAQLGAKDLSLLMRKQKIPKEIRALLGEYMDVRINFAKTATKQGRLIFNQRFLNKVLEEGLGKFLWTKDDRPPEAYKEIAPDSKNYSPLGGYFTLPEYHQAFKDALGPGRMDGWYQTIVKWNGLVKYGKTVLSPTTAMRNWMSASFFAIANGHFDASQMKRSFASAREYFSHKGGGMDYLRMLKKYGVVYDTPYAGEMMRLLKESQLEDFLIGRGNMMPGKKFLDLATSFYGFGDDFWKIMGFENEVALLMKHKKLSLEDARVQAAERIRNTYPTYSMTGRFVNTLRRFPLAGTFVSFPSEIIRTTYHMLRYLQQDMADPDLRPLAMRRILGLSLASGMAYGAQVAFMAMMGVDEDEEEAFRDLAAPWQKNSNIIPLSRDENGNLRFLDVSFLDPYNYWKRPINAILRDQPYEDMAISIAEEVFLPFFGTDIAAGAIRDVFTNTKETGGRVFNPQADPLSQLGDITNHLRKALQPGAASNVERMVKAMAGKISPSGRKYTMSDEMSALMGFRVSTHDPRAALYYKSFEFRDMKRDATSIMTAVARDPNAVSEGELVGAYERAMVVRSRAYVQMARMVSAARESGMSDDMLRRVLRQSGISKNDVNSLMRSEVPKYRPSKGYLRQAVNKARILFPDKAAEIEGRRAALTGLSR